MFLNHILDKRMNKISFFLFLILTIYSFYSFGFAQEQPGVIESRMLEGMIVEIIQPDPINGIKHEMVVAGENGRMRFLLASGIGVYGQDWEVLSLKKIKVQDKVTVEYIPAKIGGSNRVISITKN
jgi:hypothetical protein